MLRTPDSIEEVVTSGLCIGCGLCESVTGHRVRMRMTSYGSLRPESVDQFTDDEQRLLLAACPGVSVTAREPQPNDLQWGHYADMRYAWAADTEIRFKGATAGVLTALATFLLESETVEHILHVSADPERPLRNRSVVSRTPQEVLQRAGSRYAPVAMLDELHEVLELEQPFAIVGKPCDLSAIHNLSAKDERINQYCMARLVMVCGGQSRLGKSTAWLDELGVREKEVSVLRYRGHGNPGKTHLETRDGRQFETTYNHFWEDENSWMVETRCKVCVDPLGEAADIAVADVWPDANPSGEDEGFSGVVARNSTAVKLLADAEQAGHIVIGNPITPREFDNFQPHQVRKKQALAARFQGMVDAGLPVLKTAGLRLEELAKDLDETDYQAQRAGTLRRINDGRFREPRPGEVE